MLTYEIHPILCDGIHYIDSKKFKVAKATKIIMNLYLLSIQKAPFITHYKCQENFTPELNIYRGWTVKRERERERERESPQGFEVEGA
jgi:hypothetical protein